MTNFGPRADLTAITGRTSPNRAWRRETIRTWDTSPSIKGAFCAVRGRQDDDRHARQADAPLRHRRDRQYQLAVQKPLLSQTIANTGTPASPTPPSSGGNFSRAAAAAPAVGLRPPSIAAAAAHSHPDCREPVFSACSLRQGGRYWTRKGVAFGRDLTSRPLGFASSSVMERDPNSRVNPHSHESNSHGNATR
jgi:hypothetical protein